MKSMKLFSALVLAVIISSISSTAIAAPLPDGTRLGIEQGVGADLNHPCPVGGSCFSMEIAPGFDTWTDFGPGTDGGFILGKDQVSGGQELAPNGTTPTPGELSSAWSYFSNYGTFATTSYPALGLPVGASDNVFDSNGCTLAGCVGKTELNAFYIAWNGNVFSMGSSNPCTGTSCSPDQQAGISIEYYTIDLVDGGAWSLYHKWVVPADPPSSFTNVKFGVILRGRVTLLPCGDCDDNDACTVDSCDGDSGTCVNGPLSCDDNNVCTDDAACDPVNGCIYANNTLSCDDGNDCTTGGVCSNGVCAGTPVSCDDGDACTIDSCGEGDCTSVLDCQLPGCSEDPRCAIVPPSTLPNGTKLSIIQGAGSGFNIPCTTGSCFSMEVAPGFDTWTEFGPGTDGGFILGKDQVSGGQELAPSGTNSTTGELSDAWSYFSNFGTFTTTPYPALNLPVGAADNLFDDTGCTLAGCQGSTELNAWYVCWNGGVYAMGSGYTCDSPTSCSADQLAGISLDYYTIDPTTGGDWSIYHKWVVPLNPPSSFGGVKFGVIMRGTVTLPSPECIGQPEGTLCDDNNACTTNDGCSNGLCVGTQMDCDDGNICTTDTCNTGTGSCEYANNNNTCDDNDFCTINDMCSSGVCAGTPGTPINCNDFEPCTDDSCANGSCMNIPNTDPCDDNNACTMGDVCSGGTCQQGSPVICPDSGNICTSSTCDPATGTCATTNNSDACNDNDVCTSSDTCSNGVCSGMLMSCDEQDACPAPQCASILPNGTKLSIEHGVGSGFDIPCTTGSCFSMEVAPGQSIWTDFGPGTDGGFIVGKDQVSGGQDLAPSGTNSTSGELSNAWNFFNNYGTFATTPYPGRGLPVGASANRFSDADCTGAGCLGKTELNAWYAAWNGQVFALGSGYPCDSPTICSADQLAGISIDYYTFDPTTGGDWSIYHKWMMPFNPPSSFSGVKFGVIMRGTVALPSPECIGQPEGTLCDDNNACTTDDGCSNGLCGGTQMDCDDGNICTTDTCNAGTGSCEYANNNNTCDDNDFCTINDMCSSGVCAGTPGTPINCNDFEPCTDDSCANGSCMNIPNTDPCDDNSACTMGDVCSGGTCQPGSPVICPDTGNICTSSTCDPATGTCATTNNSDACNDNDVCTSSDTCSNGVCSGMLMSCDEQDACPAPQCAAILPNGTKLSIEQGVLSGFDIPCTTGSCFSMGVAPGVDVWTGFGPGTDGGFIVGRDQVSGGQELAPSGTNSTSGELSHAWNFFNNYGTFATTSYPARGFPVGASANIFSDADCSLAGCIGKTELNAWYVTWNGNVYPMGSGYPCLGPNCSVDQQNGISLDYYTIDPMNGGAWSIHHKWVVPHIDGGYNAFENVRFGVIMRGTVALTNSCDGVICDDNNPCTDDSCVNGACQYGLNTDPCDDYNPCTESDVCSNGTCKGTLINCDDNNICTTDYCIRSITTGFCRHDANTLPCNDDNICTLDDTCGSRVCQGTPLCDDNDICTTDTCDPETSVCTNTRVSPTCGEPGTPLPIGTKLGIEQGVGSDVNVPCTTGSCFSMEVAPGASTWTDFGPGTDGGFIVGKDQVSGGQETGGSSASTTPGELSFAWTYFGYYGTFATTPYPALNLPVGASDNLFADANCTLADCLGKTELNAWYVAWNGSVTSTGSGYPCTDTACSEDQTNGISLDYYTIDPRTGGDWSIYHQWVIPITPPVAHPGTRFGVIMRGTVTLPDDSCDGVICDDGDACTEDSCAEGICASALNCLLSGCDADPRCAPSPLPEGTLLSITTGTGSEINVPCATGSCFGMVVAPGFETWTDFGPGTDNGFVLGKDQISGGQEDGPSAGNTNPGELTNAWLYFNNYGTFFTAAAPDSGLPKGAEENIFDESSCTGDGCIGRTTLGSFSIAWNYGIFPVGSAMGCNGSPVPWGGCEGVTEWTVTPSPAVTGSSYVLTYAWLVPQDTPSSFSPSQIKFILRGTVTLPDPCDGVICDDGNICTSDSCDPATGECVYAPIPDFGPTGLACDDGNLCTTGDVCSGGVCRGAMISCDDGIDCTTDTCDTAAGCVHTPIPGCGVVTDCTGLPVGTLCDDSRECTTNDRCIERRGKMRCRGTRVSNGTSCDDGNLCTTDDVCRRGRCRGRSMDCRDSDRRTRDSCDPETGTCVHTPR